MSLCKTLQNPRKKTVYCISHMPELNTCHSLGLKSGALGTRATCLHLQVRYERKGLEPMMGQRSSHCRPSNLRWHPNTPRRVT